jgi:tetratricopeptide (TPR) repeat protein
MFSIIKRTCLLWLSLSPMIGGVNSIQAADDPLLEEYFIASAAYNRKLFPVAVAQFESFLSKNGNHSKADLARRGLALSFYSLKLYDKAMPYLDTLLKKPRLDKEIDRERIIMLQGRCMLNTGRKEDARNLFIEQQKNLKNQSFKVAALAAICDVSFSKSEWESVIEWSIKLSNAKPSPDQAARGLYQRGLSFYQLKKYKESAEALAQVADLQTSDQWKVMAAYLQGQSYLNLNEYEKAEPVFVAALSGMSGPDAEECRYQLGLARFLLKKFDLAKSDFETYLTMGDHGGSKKKKGKKGKNDQSPETLAHPREAKFYLARCLLELEDYKKAGQKFAELAGDNDLLAAKSTLWWGRVFSRRQDNFDRSAEILGESISRFRSSEMIDDIEFDYANALMAKIEPDWKKASDALAHIESRRKFGQMEEVLAQRATCLHKIKDYGNSLNVTVNSLSKFPEHSLTGDMLFLRAENLYLLNRGDEAAKAYVEFVQAGKEHPNLLAAQMRLAQVHHHAKRWDQALASARPLLDKKPEGVLFAQLSFVIGDSYFRQEKWKDSIQPLEDFVGVKIKDRKKPKVTAGPNLDTALIQLAVAHDRNEEMQKALENLFLLTDHYPEETPHLPMALAEQGRLSYLTGDLKRARMAMEKFLAKDKENKDPFKRTAPAQRSRVNYYLGWVEATENKHEQAAERFAKVQANDSLGPDAAFQRGIALIQGENFEEAAKHFPQMIRQFREHEKLPLIIYYAGLSATKKDDWDTASNYFKEVTEKHPKSELADQALYEWAWAQRARKRDKEATALYEKLLADHPQSPLVIKVQSEMAELNLDVGAQEKVIAELTVTLNSMKDEALRESIRIQLASAHYKKGDNQIAAAMFEELLADYPDSKLRASMLFQAGESRFRIKETMVARDHFEAASKIRDLDKTLAESALMRLGETQALTGKQKEATKTYQDFLLRFKESKWTRNARFGLAFALENNDKPSEAIREYSKLFEDAKKVDLWTVRAQFQTGECYFNMKKYDQAIARFVHLEIDKTFKKYPSWQAKSILEIGRVLLAQSKREEAIQRFKDILNHPVLGKEKAATVARQLLDQLRSG